MLYARTTRITPTTTTEALPSTPVNLIFSHLLSRVRFTFTNGFAANAVASLSVSNLTIKSVPISGTITPAKADAKWVTDTDADKKEDISFAQIRGITTNDDGKVKSTEHKYVIPTDGTGTYQVTFTVTLTQGSAATDYTFISTIPVAMVMGHSYDYAATISPDNIIQGGADLTPIEFTASVTPWKDWDDDDENDNDKIVPLPL